MGEARLDTDRSQRRTCPGERILRTFFLVVNLECSWQISGASIIPVRGNRGKRRLNLELGEMPPGFVPPSQELEYICLGKEYVTR